MKLMYHIGRLILEDLTANGLHLQNPTENPKHQVSNLIQLIKTISPYKCKVKDACWNCNLDHCIESAVKSLY